MIFSWVAFCKKLTCLFFTNTDLVRAGEERLAGVHLDQDTAQAPHVDGQVVGSAQEHLRRAVEAALDILVDLMEQAH